MICVVGTILLYSEDSAAGNNILMERQPKPTITQLEHNYKESRINKIIKNLEDNLELSVSLNKPEHKLWLDYLNTEKDYITGAINILGTGYRKKGKFRDITGNEFHNLCDLIKNMENINETRYKCIVEEITKNFPSYPGIDVIAKDDYQIHSLLKLTKTAGHLKEGIEVLAETGYKLTGKGGKFGPSDTKIINSMANTHLSRYKIIVDTFKEILAYPGAKDPRQVKYITGLTQMAGDMVILAKDFKEHQGGFSGEGGLMSDKDFEKMQNKLKYGYFEYVNQQ